MRLGNMFGNFKGNRMAKQISFMNSNLPKPDLSNQKVFDVSQGDVDVRIPNPMSSDQKIDEQTVKLINWLAQEQGLSPEAALKKAIITAAYIYDVKSNQRGELFVQHPDGSVRKIFLK